MIKAALSGVDGGDMLLVTLLVAVVAFFLKDFFKKTDHTRDDIRDILKTLGLLEAAKERSLAKDTEHSQILHEIQREMREIRDQVIVLNHEAKK